MKFLLPWRVWIIILIPILLLMIGTIGYRVVEGPHWTWFDALYMTSITLTTVGYGEIPYRLSNPGRAFTIFLMFGGVFTLFYTVSEIIRIVVTGEMQSLIGKKRMERTLANLKNHVVICGFGRMGKLISQEFEKEKQAYVVIDHNAERLQESMGRCGVTLQGDATSDDTLKLAGVERAKALVTVLPSDADNLYITLSARVLNDQIKIVARAEEQVAVNKLKRVGASYVVAPYVIGGLRVAQIVLQPTLGDVLENTTQPGNHEFFIREIVVPAGSEFHQLPLKDSRIHEDFGAVILLIKTPQGQNIYYPQGNTILIEGAVLVIVGNRDKILELEKRIQKSMIEEKTKKTN